MFVATPRVFAIALSTVFVVFLLILLAGNVRASGGPTYVWGDLNCDESVDPLDGLLILRHDAGLSTNTGACPDIGATLDVTVAAVLTWGDLDCSGLVDPIDALKTLRHDAALGYTKVDTNCPDAGDTVTAGTGETPTPAPTETDSPTPTATATPTPTETPIATPTPQPSPTPTPTLAPFPDQCPSFQDPPPAIADNGGPQLIFSSGYDSFQVTDVTVCLEVDHTFVGDIKVWLEHGTTIVVLQENIENPGNPNPGTCAGQNMFVIYTDDAPDPVQDSCEPTQDPALLGYYSPKDALSVFNGVDAGSAEWELFIEDTSPGETGVIVSRQLTVE